MNVLIVYWNLDTIQNRTNNFYGLQKFSSCILPHSHIQFRYLITPQWRSVHRGRRDSINLDFLMQQMGCMEIYPWVCSLSVITTMTMHLILQMNGLCTHSLQLFWCKNTAVVASLVKKLTLTFKFIAQLKKNTYFAK